MSENETHEPIKVEAALPEPIIHRRKRGRPSAVWLVPIIAVVAAGALAVRSYLSAGPTIHISFNDAEGLEAGKSEVRYKNVPIGIVSEVDLLPDRRISATVKLTRGGSLVAVKDSRFWVERPRVGLGGVSGLGTLLSGAYIGVDVGTDTEKADTFVGLEKPPGVTLGRQGTHFKLTSTEGGSLAPQMPVYLRRQTAGTVTAVDVTPDGRGLAIEIFIDRPYDKYVTTDTVFWNASGLDVTLDATGLRVNTQSLATVIAGGIAFGARDPDKRGPPAPEGTTFTLFEDRAHAVAKPDSVSVPLAMRFHQPIRGLGKGVGVNIELEGLHIGDVTGVNAGYDTTTRAFYFDVNATVYPERLGSAYATLVEEGARTGKSGLEMLQGLVKRGLRAQLRSGNLLTGSFFIALDWFPNDRTTASAPIASADVWVVPTVRGGTDQIQDQVQSLLAKIDRIPFEDIGIGVRDASRAATSLLGRVDRDVLPKAQALLSGADVAMASLRDALKGLSDNVAAPDSALQQSTRSAIEQVERAAFSLRGLADYIKSHPESLVRGRAPSPEPKTK